MINSGNQNRLIIFAVVIVMALLFLFPTLRLVYKQATGQEITAADRVGEGWFSKPISLGLDLSGGVHLVYQVEVAEAVKGRMQVNANAIRNKLRKAKIAVTKAKLNNKNQIEIDLLGNRKLEEAKQEITEYSKYYDLVSSTNTARGVRLTYAMRQDQQQAVRVSAVEQAIETLRARVDQFGVAEPVIQKVGTDRILLQMPGIQDIESVKKVVGRVAKLEFRLLPPPGDNKDTVTLKDQEGIPIVVEDSVQLDGSAVDSAAVAFDPNGQVEVSLTFNPDGAKTFAAITGSNVNRNLAIILDGVVYSSPTIRERISGGRCSISGGFSMQEAQELAIVLRAGALPAPLTSLEERTVGPSLGAESIRKGVRAIVIGFVLILVFMMVYYKKSGVVASAILALNIVLVLAALSAFGATLTLPGLAGLALTVGMAVDANVISFERIREELRNGVDRDMAVQTGFEKALSAILDSNITTLLAGFVLYYFGSGPIRGFAVTLSIGVLTTIFCATFVVRLAFDLFELKRKDSLSI